MSISLVKNIVVAVNGSQSSIHAAMYGIILAKQLKLNLKFVYVVDTATIKRLTMGHFLVADESEMYEKSLTSDGEKYIDYVIELAEAKGLKAKGEIRKGSVCLEVVNCVKETEAELLILGGEKGVSAKSYSWENTDNSLSLANREIIANAPCSVIVVKDPDIEIQYKHLQ